MSDEALVHFRNGICRVVVEAFPNVLPRFHPEGGVHLDDVALRREDVVRGATVHHVLRVKQLQAMGREFISTVINDKIMSV